MAEYISKFNTSEGAKQVDYNALGNLPTIPSKTSDLNNDSNFISFPATAEVGQVLEVEAVDETGKPTSWKVVNMPESLPNPHALTFTGAVTDTYNGSEAKTIEIPSGASGGSEPDEIICDIKTTDAVASISQDIDNKRYRLMFVCVKFQGLVDEMNPEGITAGFRQRLQIKLSDGTIIGQSILVSLVGTRSTPVWHVNFAIHFMSNAIGITIMRTEQQRNLIAAIKETGAIHIYDVSNYTGVSQIKFGAEGDNNLLMTAGAEMKAYGSY